MNRYRSFVLKKNSAAQQRQLAQGKKMERDNKMSMTKAAHSEVTAAVRMSQTFLRKQIDAEKSTGTKSPRSKSPRSKSFASPKSKETMKAIENTLNTIKANAASSATLRAASGSPRKESSPYAQKWNSARTKITSPRT